MYRSPVYRRRAPARKYPTRTTRSVYTKKVKPVRYALPALARQVAKIQRTVKAVTSEVQYGSNANNPIGNVGGTNVYTLPLSQFSGWGRIFGTDADDESNHSALWKKSNFDFEIDTSGEADPIDYSMYIVTLTKLGMEELFTPASGGLAGPAGITPPVNGTHFVIGGTYGMAWLNRKYFNIIKSKRFITGAYGAPAADANTLRKRFYVKMSHNGGKGHVIKNPKGDWKAQPSPTVPAQNYYLLLFNNDSTVDGQSVQLRMNAIHTLQIS